MNELLILVDENDREIGVMEKMPVHRQGLLHRAFSVFIFNSGGQLLLQQRADEKYHSAGLWSNTCCSHPLKGENLSDTIQRRLEEEMGMRCNLEFMFSFIYKTNLQNDLIEHELDHVYFGVTDDQPVLNPYEVKDWKYIDLADLETDIKAHPDNYTAWLEVCLPKVSEYYSSYFKFK
jgi:isopentenyl-diphosphate Delta-isomerase